MIQSIELFHCKLKSTNLENFSYKIGAIFFDYCCCKLLLTFPAWVFKCLFSQGNQFDGATMHRKGDGPRVRGEDNRFGDGLAGRVADESDDGCHPTGDSHAEACHGPSVYQ